MRPGDRGGVGMNRFMSVDGSFYPASCAAIAKMIEGFNDKLENSLQNKKVLALAPRAVIVPHAGYIYSGFTANVAYRVLKNSIPKRVIVFGPSHKIYFEGISGSFFDEYETPCKNLSVDKEYLSHLREIFDIDFVLRAHEEHSTEVQMPFVSHYLPTAKVIEFVYGKESPESLAKLIEAILADKTNAVVISTDLSHFYTQEEAMQLDMHCLKAVHDLDTKELHKGCEACGEIGLEAMILAAKNMKFSSTILDYRTSGDVTGDESSVVGYMSAAFVQG